MSGLYTWCLAVSGLYTRCLTVDELDTERRKKQNKRTRENSCLTVRGLYTIAYEVEERHALRCTEVLVVRTTQRERGGGCTHGFGHRGVPNGRRKTCPGL